MWLFWVVAGSFAAAAACLILMRAAAAAPGEAAADPAQALYRRQLSEIDELAERGLMGEAERAAARAEAGRRLLAAAAAPSQPWSSDPKAQPFVLLAVASAPALAMLLYLRLGTPGMTDQPFKARLAQWQHTDLNALSAPEIAAVLRKAVAERPGEAEGYRLLGLAENASQNPIAAVRALRKATELAPDRADIWILLGQAEIAEAGGKVDADSRAAFGKVLQLVPGEPTARFFLAGGRADAGDKDGAIADLTALMNDLPQGDPRRDAVKASIARIEGRPAMTTDPQQLAMIQGMVSRLAERLKTSPDDPEGWVRLVRAYAVLGDKAKRDDAYASARARYAQAPKVLQQLDEAVQAEGMK